MKSAIHRGPTAEGLRHYMLQGAVRRTLRDISEGRIPPRRFNGVHIGTPPVTPRMPSSLPRVPPTLPTPMLSSSVLHRDGDGFAPTTRRLHLSLIAGGGGRPLLSGARMAGEERICWASTCGDGLEDQRSHGDGRVPRRPASMVGIGSAMLGR
jgi:hypothetical protein